MTVPIPTVDNRDGRDGFGRFAPGPGNIGRPRGSKNRLSREALAAVQGISSLAILKLRELVQAGEFNAIKLVIELTVPKGGRTIELNSTDAMAWADAMADGDISPIECATAAQALVKLNEASEIADLSRRIAELEAALPARR
jgi:hypothetical protein